MRIDSMDATINSSANVSALKAKQEATVNVVRNEAPANKEKKSQDDKNDDTQDKVSMQFLASAIEKANETFRIENRSLQFKIHDRTNKVMVKIIDTETNEVVREIPPEKLLDMFANMLEMAGLLVDERR